MPATYRARWRCNPNTNPETNPNPNLNLNPKTNPKPNPDINPNHRSYLLIHRTLTKWHQIMYNYNCTPNVKGMGIKKAYTAKRFQLLVALASHLFGIQEKNWGLGGDFHKYTSCFNV